MTKKIQARIISKNETAENWAKAENFQPLEGEIIIYNKDDQNPTPRLKIGDGTTKVDELPFFRGDCIGEETEEGGILLHEVGTNQALAKNTLAAGNDNWAGYYGFRIKALSIQPDDEPLDNRTEVSLSIYNTPTAKAYECYSVGDIVQMHLQSHFHDRYQIIEIGQGDPYDETTFICLRPTYDIIVTDDIKLASDKDYPDGSRNWLYVIGKPYGEPMKYSKGATAFGNHNTITGQGALGIGDDNIVLGKGAFAGGSDNKVGYAALANGTENKAIHNRSATLGRGLKSGRVNQMLVGEFNEVEENALFVVGNGTYETSRNNAFTVDKNGNAKVQSNLRVGDVDIVSKLYESPYMKVDELPESGDMDKVYITPEGQYIYGLKDKDTSTENIEIWDGSTQTAPKLVNGVYEITNGAELAYIVANGGQEGAYYKLTKDIYLNDIDKVDWKTGVANNYTPNSWYSYYNNPGFYGSIDGNGHIIYGLYFEKNPSSYVSGTYGAGLIPFAVSGQTTAINNLGVDYAYINYEGAVSAFIGDLKDSATATFSECFVGENVSIKGGSAGAFCGRTGSSAAVTLENCYSLANAVVANNDYTAGIAGVPRGNSTAITVNNSFNAKGAIFSSYYTTPRSANNSYQSVTGTKSNEIALTTDNMQGENALTSSDKMSALNADDVFIAEEGFPRLKKFVKAESVPQTWKGDTTEPSDTDGDGIIEIGKASELAYVIKNGGEGKSYILTSDIYLNDITKINWSTGTVAQGYSLNKWYSSYNFTTFSGNIDGNGHTIYGLYNNQNPSAYISYATASALIPAVTAGASVTIKNLGIDNAFINYESNASAFVGYLPANSSLVFDKCFVGDKVTLEGGFAGAFNGRADKSTTITITNSYSLAKMTTRPVEGSTAYKAGFCGNHNGCSTSVTVKNSFNGAGPIFSGYYTTPKSAENCYQTADNAPTGVTKLSVDNMQGETALTNPDKMPNLNTIPPSYIATEGFPKLILFACGWVKIDTVNKEYVDNSIQQPIKKLESKIASTKTVAEQALELSNRISNDLNIRTVISSTVPIGPETLEITDISTIPHYIECQVHSDFVPTEDFGSTLQFERLPKSHMLYGEWVTPTGYPDISYASISHLDQNTYYYISIKLNNKTITKYSIHFDLYEWWAGPSYIEGHQNNSTTTKLLDPAQANTMFIIGVAPEDIESISMIPMNNPGELPFDFSKIIITAYNNNGSDLGSYTPDNNGSINNIKNSGPSISFRSNEYVQCTFKYIKDSELANIIGSIILRNIDDNK